MHENTVLGIDPGTKEMGIAIVRGTQLLSFGVHTLRNGHRPHDLVGQARRIVLAAIAEHGPDVVAIEKPLMLPTRRAAILSVISQELRGRAEDLGLRVVELAPEDAATALVELASLQAAVAARLTAMPAPSPPPGASAELDRMLTADEVAGLLNRSRAWVYRQSKHWPFTRRLTRRTLRFSEAGLQRFLTQRRAFAP